MNKELIVTSEDIELLKEMKDNCLKSDVYDDEKRLLKANAITKILYENEKLHHYKKLYQSLKKQKEELRDYLIETITLLEKEQSYRFNHEINFKLSLYKSVLKKLEEIEGVKYE